MQTVNINHALDVRFKGTDGSYRVNAALPGHEPKWEIIRRPFIKSIIVTISAKDELCEVFMHASLSNDLIFVDGHGTYVVQGLASKWDDLLGQILTVELIEVNTMGK